MRNLTRSVGMGLAAGAVLYLAGTAGAASGPQAADLEATYGKLPAGFEANRGQTTPEVRFLSRGPGHVLFLTDTGAVLKLRRPTDHPLAGTPRDSARLPTGEVFRSWVVGMELEEASPAPRAVPVGRLPGVAHYLTGRDPRGWALDVPHYGRVAFEDVYPGIDLVYYGSEGRLEYDFVVAAGADPATVSLRFSGTRSVAVDAAGDLVLNTPLGPVVQRAPVVYQEADGKRAPVEGRYVLRDDGTVGFAVAAYDRARPLVIDPVLDYGTYLGGSSYDEGIGIAMDQAGNAYVTGDTGSVNFPTKRSFDGTYSGAGDAFVVKVAKDGSRLIYATYLGGSARDSGLDIAVDDDGNVYVTGLTSSSDFPVTGNALQPMRNGGSDAFVVKLNPSGKQMEYGTYLGGSAGEVGYGIALDGGANAYVTGYTQSADFPTTPGVFQPAFAGGWAADAFVAKIGPGGGSLVYATYLGDYSTDPACAPHEWDEAQAIAVDGEGNAYITGDTTSLCYPTTPGSFQPEPSVSITQAIYPVADVVVTKLNADATALVWSSYLGSGEWNGDVDGEEEGMGIAVDAVGSAYVTGFTDRPTFPVTPGAFQTDSTASGGKDDVYVTKFSPDGSYLVYSTYIGGNTSPFLARQEFGTDIALDLDGNAYVTGWTSSSDFPTAYPIQPYIGTGRPDAFAAVVNGDGSDLLFSTFLGGNGSDRGWGVAVDACGNIYGTGVTASTNFPTTYGAFDRTCGTDGLCNRVYSPLSDAYAFKIDGNPQCGN
jgi:hypothetical protein